MKKLLLLSLFFAAPAFGWDFKSLWNLKPSMDTVNNAWESMSPVMQKVTIAAGIVAAGGAVYAAWPIKENVAVRKATRCLLATQKKIDEGKVTTNDLEIKGVFPYDFFWRGNKLIVFETSTHFTQPESNESYPIVSILFWKGGAHNTYMKNTEWKQVSGALPEKVKKRLDN